MFVAERPRFLTGVDPKAHCFDPTPHLPYLEAACYIEPRLFEVSEHTPCEVPVACFAAHRAEALKFARQLDDAGRLFLARTDEAPKSQRMNLIAVYESPEVDRIFGTAGVEITLKRT